MHKKFSQTEKKGQFSVVIQHITSHDHNGQKLHMTNTLIKDEEPVTKIESHPTGATILCH